jgi:cAMP-dependent protein kinase regulator
VLDRNTFNFIVKDAAARKREKYEQFLKSVPLLSSMDHYERSKLSDAIKELVFEPEEYIIREVSQTHSLRRRKHLIRIG